MDLLRIDSHQGDVIHLGDAQDDGCCERCEGHLVSLNLVDLFELIPVGDRRRLVDADASIFVLELDDDGL